MNSIAGAQNIRRKPLQPINNSSSNIQIVTYAASLSKTKQIETISPNSTPIPQNLSTATEIVLADANSLAEELSSMSKKIERMRLDMEKTEKILTERESAMELWNKEIGERGEVQKMFEIQVDRLFRLKELKLTRVSPIRSLREKQGEKRFKDAQFPDVKADDDDESINKSESCGSNSGSLEAISED